MPGTVGNARDAHPLLQARFLARQFAANLGVAVVLTLVITALVFHGRTVVPLWGAGNLAFDLIPSTLLPTVGAAIAITRATALAVGQSPIKPGQTGLFVMLPLQDALAGLVIGLILLALLGPGFVGAVSYAYDQQPIPYASVVVCKLIYALVLCLANTPLIVWRAKQRS